jgi:hypothetical protein
MKNKKVVFYQSGEINGTFAPKCFLENFKGDLEEICTRLISNDFWEPITVKYYKVSEVVLPEWMTEDIYLKEYIKLNFAIAQGMPLQFNSTQYYNYVSLPEKYQYFVSWLLKKHTNTSNEFMRSIVEQVNNWMQAEKNKYDKPLSETQFSYASKYCPLYNAAKNSAKAYYTRF